MNLCRASLDWTGEDARPYIDTLNVLSFPTGLSLRNLLFVYTY